MKSRRWVLSGLTSVGVAIFATPVFAQTAVDQVVGRLEAVKTSETELDGEVAAGRKIPDPIAEMLDGPNVDWIE